jgi:CheY-like chemotaxis protein
MLPSALALPLEASSMTTGPVSILRVLIVDDVKDAADSLAVLVALWGHETQVAYDGPGALDAARTFRPHVVFLDLAMPGMSGFEVARQLRELDGLNEVLIVAVTGASSHGRMQETEFMASGILLRVLKPCPPQHLECLLAEVKAGKRPAPPPQSS